MPLFTAWKFWNGSQVVVGGHPWPPVDGRSPAEWVAIAG